MPPRWFQLDVDTRYTSREMRHLSLMVSFDAYNVGLEFTTEDVLYTAGN